MLARMYKWCASKLGTPKVEEPIPTRIEVEYSDKAKEMLQALREAPTPLDVSVEQPEEGSIAWRIAQARKGS